MKTVIIAEKASQGRTYRNIGVKGTICVLSGHVFDTCDPHEINPDWMRWSMDVLAPQDNDHIYPYKISTTPHLKKLWQNLKSELDDADEVIIATDADEEGHVIGMNPLRYYAENVKKRPNWLKHKAIYRVLGDDNPVTAKENFNLRKRVHWKDWPDYHQGLARASADKIGNYSLTRFCTLLFKDKLSRKVVNVGRVKTPVLWIIVKRHLDIINFVAKDQYSLKLHLITPDGKKFSLNSKGTFDDYDEANILLNKIKKCPTTIITLNKRQVKEGPPLLFNIASLSKHMSKYGWGADKTEKTLQKIYEQPLSLVTYPRAEVKYIAETTETINGVESVRTKAPKIYKNAHNFIAKNTPLFPNYKNMQYLQEKPTVRVGKKGTYSDKEHGGCPHHAIIVHPEADYNKFNSLNDDEKTLFLEILLSYLRQHSPDATIDTTTISCKLADIEFKDSHKDYTEYGWRYLNDMPATKMAPAYLELKTGEEVQIIDAEVVKGKTTPPPPFKITSFPEDVMSGGGVAKLLPDDTDNIIKEKVKNSKGLGTPATRTSILKDLKDNGFINVDKKQVMTPTDAAIDFINILCQDKAYLPIYDPSRTAIISEKRKAIGKEYSLKQYMEEFIDELIGLKDGLLQSSHANLSYGTSSPSDKQKFLLDKIKANGGKVPDESYDDFTAASAIIAANEAILKKPSEKQMNMALKLAEEKSISIDDEALADGKKLSKWIDKNMTKKREKRSK